MPAKKPSNKRRLTAEGLIIALEFMAVHQMKNEEKAKNKGRKKPLEVKAVIQERESGGFEMENFPALVFSITHPWVELHTKIGHCGSTKAEHEHEYTGMLEIADKMLSSRFGGDTEENEED